jgi:hypothetical protein
MSGLFVIQVYNKKKKDWIWLKGGTYAADYKKNMTPSEKYSFLGNLEPFDSLTLALKKLNYHLGFSEAGFSSLRHSHGIYSVYDHEFKTITKHRIINIVDNCNTVIELTLNETPYHYMKSTDFSEHLGDQNNVCFDSEYGKEIFKFSCESTQNEKYLGCSLNLDEYKSKIESFYKKAVNINVLEKY